MHGYSGTARPHHVGATPAALASGSEAGADVLRRSSSAVFCRLQDFIIRRTHSNFEGRCSVAVDPRLWNSLPAGLHKRTSATNSLSGC